jgi:hypothetical protein
MSEVFENLQENVFGPARIRGIGSRTLKRCGGIQSHVATDPYDSTTSWFNPAPGDNVKVMFPVFNPGSEGVLIDGLISETREVVFD